MKQKNRDISENVVLISLIRRVCYGDVVWVGLLGRFEGLLALVVLDDSGSLCGA